MVPRRCLRSFGKNSGSSPGFAHGFSLIEATIVLLIVSLLASLLISSYSHYTQRTRRVEMQRVLLTMHLVQLSYYRQHARYAQTLSELQLPQWISESDFSAHYQLQLTTLSSPHAFQLTALARSGTSQADDSGCLSMSVNEMGWHTPDTGCWP